MGRRVLVTGLGTFWGGRVAKALEADPTVDVIVGLDTREPHGRARAHRVRPQRRELLDPVAHRAGHPGRHDRAHVPGRRLDADVAPDDARDQRHRHDEPVRRGRTDSHGAQRRREVVGLRVRQPPTRPGVVHRGDRPQRAAPPPGRALADSRSSATSATSPSTTRTSRCRCCGSPTCSAPRSPRRCRRCSRRRSCPSIFGFDPRFQFVHEDDVIRAVLFVLDNDLAGVFNVAGDGLLPWSEVAGDLRQAHRSAPAHRPEHRRRRAPTPRASTSRPRSSTCSATAGASTTAG